MMASRPAATLASAGSVVHLGGTETIVTAKSEQNWQRHNEPQELNKLTLINQYSLSVLTLCKSLHRLLAVNFQQLSEGSVFWLTSRCQLNLSPLFVNRFRVAQKTCRFYCPILQCHTFAQNRNVSDSFVTAMNSFSCRW